MEENSESQGAGGQAGESSTIPNPNPRREGTALDLTDPRDQAMVRNFVVRNKRRWRMIDDEVKDEFTATLAMSANVARCMMGADDTSLQVEGAKLASSVVKTLTVMEGQNQSDEHRADENDRADSGKLKGRIAVDVTFEDRIGL